MDSNGSYVVVSKTKESLAKSLAALKRREGKVLGRARKSSSS